METDIKLNFVNESNDQNNSEIVFFQKNVATDLDEAAVAWKVIKNCATGWHHKFIFPTEIRITAFDSWGNEIITPIPACNGQLFHVYKDASGDQLKYYGPASSSNEVHLRNDLQMGAINANIYKNGKLLATKSAVSPEQKAVFQFKPTLWVGVVSQVQEGSIMSSAIISNINTELSLLDVASADIVMTGGRTEFKFTMENIVYA